MKRQVLSTMAGAVVVLALMAAPSMLGDRVAVAQVNGNDNNISVMDDCLPGDPAWDPTGGCLVKPHEGDVSNAEFGLLLRSPLTMPPNEFLIGHPSWRNEPSHVTTPVGKTVHVTNHGGRGHTFTEVANFGGGFVPFLNIGLTPALECNPDPTVNPNPPILLDPGASQELTGLSRGLHTFQCCIHPWMRGTIRVE